MAKTLDKKASLNIAIESIVVLIIAITVLSLGLAFVNKVMKGGMGAFDDVFNQVGQYERDMLENSPKDITMVTSVIKADKTGFAFAIRNNRRTSATFMLPTAFKCNDVIGESDLRSRVQSGEIIKFETLGDQEIKAGKSMVLPVRLNIIATAPPTTYSCSVDVKISKIDRDVLPTPQDYASLEFQVVKE